MNEYEVLVIGGGPAGLSAALYLARYDRRVALFDLGRGRSTWHQINHNYLGFPGGISARALRERGQQQLAEYPQVTFLTHEIAALAPTADGSGTFIAQGQAGSWRGRALIACTGVVDHFPHFAGWEEYVGRSLFWCLTCDGYACKGERVVVVGHTNDTAAEALQLRRFTPYVTILTNSDTYAIDATFTGRLARAGIPIVRDKLAGVVGHDGYIEALHTRGGRHVDLEQLFIMQGATPQSTLLASLGVALDNAGYIIVDTEQRRNIPGVYAAGDVTRPHSHQISAAVHEGGQAASAANYFLYPRDLRDE